MSAELLVVVNGLPAPQGSKHAIVRGGKPRVIESSKAVAPWREAVRAEVQRAIEAGGPTFPAGPVHVLIAFRLPRVRSHYTAKGVLRESAPAWVSVRPDLDKLARAVSDGITDGGAIRDDAQVALLTVAKAYAETSGATIRIREAPPANAELLNPHEGAAR